MPLIMTHGWPGSIFELLKVIGPLTDPTAYGGRAEDAFDLVLPSMPDYGFSGKPQGTGWNPDHIARLGRVDAASGIQTLCCARRRLGFGSRGRDGASGAAGTARHPHQHAIAGLFGGLIAVHSQGASLGPFGLGTYRTVCESSENSWT